MLNRHDAKKWLGANYKNFISTEELSFFSGAQYWPYSRKECIEHHVSLGAKKLILNWGENLIVGSCYLLVLKTIARWAEDTSLEIDISLPQTIIDSKAYLAELKFLQTHFNVQFY